MRLKALLLKCFLLGSAMVALYFLVQYHLTKRYVDDMYPKFTYPASSLILGVSRAQDGIAPYVLEQKLNDDLLEKPMLNFAFHLSQSPYGPVYLEAIKKKIKPGTTKGVFILSVSPGNISIPHYLDDSPEKFSDKFSVLAKVNDFNSDPNFNYIRKVYGKALYKSFIGRVPDIRTMHRNGWMEVNIRKDGIPVYDNDLAKWKHQIIESYKSYEGFYKLSDIRFKSLEETIHLLKNYGTVFLVRMPVSTEVLDLEQQFMPHFDSLLSKLSSQNRVLYMNYAHLGGHFEFYDGAHLSKDGAVKFSTLLSEDIKNHLIE